MDEIEYNQAVTEIKRILRDDDDKQYDAVIQFYEGGDCAAIREVVQQLENNPLVRPLWHELLTVYGERIESCEELVHFYRWLRNHKNLKCVWWKERKHVR